MLSALVDVLMLMLLARDKVKIAIFDCGSCDLAENFKVWLNIKNQKGSN